MLILSNWKEDVKALLSITLRIVALVGLTLTIPGLIGLIYGEVREASFFMIYGLTVFTVCYLGSRLIPVASHITLSNALLISGIGWLIVALVGAVPYVELINMSWVDAYFESMSGFTTTGMTLISFIEGVPKSVLFWRAFTQWLGGAGILMLFIIIFGGLISGSEIWALYVAEARETKIRASTLTTVRDIWIIYVFYTVLATITLWFLGMDLFDALTHSFTALATGGFSTRTESIAAFNNPYIELALSVFELVGATSFIAHYLLFKYGIKRFIQYYELRWTLGIIALSTALITLDLTFKLNLDLITSVRYAFFQVVSTMTTTGYTTVDINAWPPLSKFVLVMLMLIGGGLCSTSGAIKVGRVVIALKAMWLWIRSVFLPTKIVKPIKVGTYIITSYDMLKTFSFLVSYFLILFIGTLIITAYGYEPFAALSLMASAQGNVGPAYISLFILPDSIKILLILGMWLGRLELLPALITLISIIKPRLKP